MKTSQSAWHSVRLVHVNGLKGAKLTWLDRVGYPKNLQPRWCLHSDSKSTAVPGTVVHCNIF